MRFLDGAQVVVLQFLAVKKPPRHQAGTVRPCELTDFTLPSNPFARTWSRQARCRGCRGRTQTVDRSRGPTASGVAVLRRDALHAGSRVFPDPATSSSGSRKRNAISSQTSVTPCRRSPWVTDCGLELRPRTPRNTGDYSVCESAPQVRKVSSNIRWCAPARERPAARMPGARGAQARR